DGVLRQLLEDPIFYHQSWLTGEVPDDWKLANVTLIHKKEKTYLTLNPVMNPIQVATLLMPNNLVTAWIVPQPCQNICVTLAQTVQQENMFVHCSSRESYVYLSVAKRGPTSLFPMEFDKNCPKGFRD
ncbi:hypothetical protein HGM15179_018603, partial [Zosterops borbonicus]